MIKYNGGIQSPFYKYEIIDTSQFPDDWKVVQGYTPADIDVTVIRAQAKDNKPQAKITFLSGFKSGPEEYNIPHIHALQRAGVELDIVMLPDPGPEIGFLPDFRDIARDVFLSNPLDDGYKAGIPNYAFAHSLGARAFTRNMMDEDFAEHINNNYTGSVMNAAHFVSPYRANFLARNIYDVYSSKYSKSTYGSTSLDKAIIWASNMKEDVRNRMKNITSSFNKVNGVYIPHDASASAARTGSALTHGQISYCNIEGEDLWRRMMENPVPQAAKEFPMIMLAGSRDIVSSSKYIEKAADLFNARYCELDAHHNPFFQSKEGRHYVLKAMREMTHGWQDFVIQKNDDTSIRKFPDTPPYDELENAS